MQTERCPRCNSREIRGGKQDQGNDTLYDFYCGNCRLFESCLRSSPEFARWRARWSDPGAAIRSNLRAAIAAAPSAFHRRLAEADVRFTAARDGERWLPAALEVTGRAELWLFLDDDAVAACRTELGAERLGDVAPAAPIAQTLASLPATIGAVWVNPFDRQPGLVIAGDDLAALRRWGQCVVTERGLRTRGAAALYEAPDVAVGVIEGALATDGDAVVVLTAPDAEDAYRTHVAAGTQIAFVHQPGADLRDKLRDRSRAIVNPAGPGTLSLALR